MAKAPLFTVAIICFNRAAMVRLAIESALRQDFDDYDVLIVDDASTDGSAEVIREYADRASVVIRDQNGGEMAARNTAMAAVQGDYVCFLDSDDVWFHWTLSTFAEAVRRHNSPSMVVGRLVEFRQEEELKQVDQDSYRDSVSSCYFAGDRYSGVMSAAIRRQAIEQCGGFIDRRINCLDSDMMFRVGDLPGMVAIETPCTLGYRVHESILGNTAMSYAGATHLIEFEKAGKYPGGRSLRGHRLRHITVRTRGISLQCLRQRQRKLAGILYWKTIGWNFRVGQWPHVIALPLWMVCPPLLTLKERVAAWNRDRQKMSAARRTGLSDGEATR